MTQSDTVQGSYDVFKNKLDDYIIGSSKRITCKSNKFLKQKPWITTGIINSIKYRDNLKRKFIKNKTLENKCEYTKYRNLLNKIIRG